MMSVYPVSPAAAYLATVRRIDPPANATTPLQTPVYQDGDDGNGSSMYESKGHTPPGTGLAVDKMA
jgi:hypothetical protein